MKDISSKLVNDGSILPRTELYWNGCVNDIVIVLCGDNDEDILSNIRVSVTKPPPDSTDGEYLTKSKSVCEIPFRESGISLVIP